MEFFGTSISLNYDESRTGAMTILQSPQKRRTLRICGVGSRSGNGLVVSLSSDGTILAVGNSELGTQTYNVSASDNQV